MRTRRDGESVKFLDKPKIKQITNNKISKSYARSGGFDGLNKRRNREKQDETGDRPRLLAINLKCVCNMCMSLFR